MLSQKTLSAKVIRRADVKVGALAGKPKTVRESAVPQSTREGTPSAAQALLLPPPHTRMSVGNRALLPRAAGVAQRGACSAARACSASCLERCASHCDHISCGQGVPASPHGRFPV